MARHIGRFANLDPFGLQRGHRRHRRGHQRRLGVLCEGQRLDVPLPDQVRQFFAKGVIDFLENGAGFRIGFGQIAAMPMVWAPWPGKTNAMLMVAASLMRFA